MLTRLLELVFPMDAREMARRELAEAKRELLLAHSGVEFSKAMVRYQSSRVVRLTIYLEGDTPLTGKDTTE